MISNNRKEKLTSIALAGLLLSSVTFFLEKSSVPRKSSPSSSSSEAVITLKQTKTALRHVARPCTEEAQ